MHSREVWAFRASILRKCPSDINAVILVRAECEDLPVSTFSGAAARFRERLRLDPDGSILFLMPPDRKTLRRLFGRVRKCPSESGEPQDAGNIW